MGTASVRPLQGPGLFGSSVGFLLSLLNWPRGDDARNYLNPDGRRRLLAVGNGTDVDADNPYWSTDKNPQTEGTNRFVGNVQLSFSPTKWLTLSHNIGSDFYTITTTPVRGYGTSQVGNQTGGIAQTVDQFRLITATTLATLTPDFGPHVGASLVVGNTIEEN